MRTASQPQDHLSLEPVPSSSRDLSRRQFAFAATKAGAVALTAAGVSAHAESERSAFGPRPEDLSLEEWSEVQARYQNLLRVYGERLSPQQKHTLANVLTTNEHMLHAIRSFVVQNGDPSALTLRLVSKPEAS